MFFYFIQLADGEVSDAEEGYDVAVVRMSRAG